MKQYKHVIIDGESYLEETPNDKFIEPTLGCPVYNRILWQGPELKDGEVLEDSQIEKGWEFNNNSNWTDCRNLEAAMYQGFETRQVARPKAEVSEEVIEHNASVWKDNKDELFRIFEKALASDGGEYWVCPDIIIEGLSEAGYKLTKPEGKPLSEITAKELFELAEERVFKELKPVAECPECKTKNYHYHPKTQTWCCAFC